MIAAGELLEWAEIFGHRSGTPAAPVRRGARGRATTSCSRSTCRGPARSGRPMPEAVLILLEPPSMEELERRLRSRGTEDEERLARRLAKAEWELGQRSRLRPRGRERRRGAGADEVAAIIEGSRPPAGGTDPAPDPGGPANP